MKVKSESIHLATSTKKMYDQIAPNEQGFVKVWYMENFSFTFALLLIYVYG